MTDSGDGCVDRVRGVCLHDGVVAGLGCREGDLLACLSVCLLASLPVRPSAFLPAYWVCMYGASLNTG